jgi:prevent-host-death family protein
MEISISQARDKLSDLLNEVAFGGKSFTITRRGKSLAALVPVTDEDNKAIRPESNKEIKEESL